MALRRSRDEQVRDAAMARLEADITELLARSGLTVAEEVNLLGNIVVRLSKLSIQNERNERVD